MKFRIAEGGRSSIKHIVLPGTESVWCGVWPTVPAPSGRQRLKMSTCTRCERGITANKRQKEADKVKKAKKAQRKTKALDEKPS